MSEPERIVGTALRDFVDTATQPRLDADALWRTARRRHRAAITTCAAGVAAAVLVPLAVLASPSKPPSAISPGPASSQAVTWTKQHPPVSPSAREASAMAYDAATGTAVLFGGGSIDSVLGDTWTWNGTTWTKQHPAISPPARFGGAMTYDPATRTIVLFGGGNDSHGYLADTWTWNGTTWTKQHPAISPPARAEAAITYDAATRTIVLFGGDGGPGLGDHALGDTWSWNGTTWTKQHPAVSPAARFHGAMAYDPATGNAVLFGGQNENIFGDTWTWNGTTWTKQHPAVSPIPTFAEAMAYDAATHTGMIFGGMYIRGYLSDTWTWR